MLSQELGRESTASPEAVRGGHKAGIWGCMFWGESLQV